MPEDVRTEGAPAGIDMTSPEPIQRAFGVLSKMVDRLAEIIGGAVP
jgi:oligoendopeptidase F